MARPSVTTECHSCATVLPEFNSCFSGIPDVDLRQMYGTYIQAARERAGLSRAEFARVVGYDGPDMIRKIETDAANVSLQKLDQMAQNLGCRIGDLLPNSGAGPTNDLCSPILAALAGLDLGQSRELVNNLAEQARIMISWRRRDDSAGKTETRPSTYTDTLQNSGKTDEFPEQVYRVNGGNVKETARDDARNQRPETRTAATDATARAKSRGNR